MEFSSKTIILILVQIVACHASHYLITTSKRYNPGETKILEVEIFGQKPCDVSLTIAGYIFGGKQIVMGKVRQTVAPGKRNKIPVKISSVSDIYSVTLKGKVCGKDTPSRYLYRPYTTEKTILIQTDKPIYKPGQKVRMRIVSLDRKLKPAGDKLTSVIVEEPSGSRVMQWDDVKLEDGIASLELPLSSEPVLGKWKITVKAGTGLRAHQIIEVAKYVLPKFEVQLTPPAYVALDMPSLTTKICATYTYGKPVKGKMNAVICSRYSSYDPWQGKTLNVDTCHNITREIDGCTDVISQRDDLKLGDVPSIWGTKLTIDASVTEKLTGVKFSKSTIIKKISRRSILLSFDGTPNKFRPGMSFEYTLKVTRPDGTPATYVDVQVRADRGKISTRFYTKTFTVKNGLIKDTLKLAHTAKPVVLQAVLTPNPYITAVRRTSQRPEKMRIYARYSPSLSYIKISTPPAKPVQIGSTANVEVTYTVRNDTGKKVDFYYSVYCRGTLVTSGFKTRNHPYVVPPPPTTTTQPPPTKKPGKNKVPTLAPLTKPVLEQFNIMFPVTGDMSPMCRILVYYVRSDKETVADSVVYDVEDVLENKVSVSFADKERKPGEKTKLILKAKPGSRVAFAAVDKSVHLLRAGNEITKDKITPLIQRFDTGPSWNTDDRNCPANPQHGKRSVGPQQSGPPVADASDVFNAAGVMFLSNLKIFTKPCDTRTGVEGIPDPTPKPGHKKTKPVPTRKDFPETWLWADAKISASGDATIEVQVPDTITSWVANGFGMSPVAGIGVSDTSYIKVFQPFFIQMTLPYSVIRGEEVPVTVTVFNYMSDCLPIELTLDATSTDYQMTTYNKKKMCVCGDSGQTVKFNIIPKSLGHIPLKVVALRTTLPNCPSSSSAFGDKVIKKLLVEPEGIEKEYTQGTFFCPKGANFDMVFDLSLPKDIVPGSVYSTFSLVGDVMGPALSNLDGLLRMPYGCGEQNMAKFAPNIYIMDYLTGTNQVTKEIRNQAENYMSTGYQRQLNYKRTSGSYSAFGNRDAKGSMMLTAFVVRSFAQAKRYIFVDDAQVAQSIKWFKARQLSNGCFPQYGKVLNKRLQGGVNSEITVTAYVAIALLESGVKGDMVKNSLNCLLSKKITDHNTYTLALISYALVLAKHPMAQAFVTEIKNRAKVKGNTMYWTADNVIQTPPKYYPWWYYRPPSADVETTGYVLLLLLKTHKGSGFPVDAPSIVRWLSKQRNAYGGFSSTQDTCVALQSLAEFAAKAFGKGGKPTSADLNVVLGIKKDFQHQFTVTKQNKLVSQRVELPQKLIPNKVNMTATGSGCGLIQATVKYNIPQPDEKPAFDIKVQVLDRPLELNEEKRLCKPLRLKISTKWLKAGTSNMAVVDVKLVSGFKVLVSSLDKLHNQAGLNFKRYDIEAEGQKVLLYFDEITDKYTSLFIDIYQYENIKDREPALVRVLDYYDIEKQAKVMYNVTDYNCYGNKIRDDCPKCVDDINMNNIAVDCNSAVARVKSTENKLLIGQGYSKDLKKANRPMYVYKIPEYCLCKEIYDDAKALLVVKKANMDAGKKEVLLGSDATIVKWDKNKMKKALGVGGTILKKLKCT